MSKHGMELPSETKFTKRLPQHAVWTFTAGAMQATFFIAVDERFVAAAVAAH